VTKSGVEGYYYYYYRDGKEELFDVEEMFSLQTIIFIHGKFFNLPVTKYQTQYLGKKLRNEVRR
jgi:hypothetical protein